MTTLKVIDDRKNSNAKISPLSLPNSSLSLAIGVSLAFFSMLCSQLPVTMPQQSTQNDQYVAGQMYGKCHYASTWRRIKKNE